MQILRNINVTHADFPFIQDKFVASLEEIVKNAKDSKSLESLVLLMAVLPQPAFILDRTIESFEKPIPKPVIAWQVTDEDIKMVVNRRGFSCDEENVANIREDLDEEAIQKAVLKAVPEDQVNACLKEIDRQLFVGAEFKIDKLEYPIVGSSWKAGDFIQNASVEDDRLYVVTQGTLTWQGEILHTCKVVDKKKVLQGKLQNKLHSKIVEEAITGIVVHFQPKEMKYWE